MAVFYTSLSHSGNGISLTTFQKLGPPAYSLKAKNWSLLSSTTLFISFLQTAWIFSQINVPWEQRFLGIFQNLAIFNFDLSLIQPDVRSLPVRMK